MADNPLLVVALAAGKGVRMCSSLPKVLHPIGGRSLLAHALAGAASLGAARVAVVVGPGMDAVRAEAARCAPGSEIFEQSEQLGTAHAVLAARPAIARHGGSVLVVFADSPLVEQATLRRMIDALDAGAHIAVLGFEPEDPNGYGRLVVDAAGRVAAIREQADATAVERRIGLCNAGAMAFRVPDLAGLLGRIGNGNAKSEYYLTDAIAIACADGLIAVPVMCCAEQALGVNSRAQLAAAEAVFQRRARARAMEGGATLIAPETVWFSYDTSLGRDVLVEPNVFFGPGVTVEDGAHIMANCHMVGARIRAGARVGPFARLRPGADIGPAAHIGNFVEVKNARLEAGAKANHLSYIGDGRVGEHANIGAGTIFCNYDGFAKHVTDVGKGAFVGSNASLVAPVKIGDGAYIGSGSVITRDVEADSLALERTEQRVHPGWAARFRRLRQKPKKGG
ncbi:MAG TPA: bifunctional UDP-N-acetylglucosamine diphosphorylase/glucosamine-1-phosphate N-acetyltransferase GlmU [Hyphomicrobiaceae bacterium]|jgi:bifunctional UDP-N-acetylglucosamine pyrophosphorylase/glucosamine-1-phosphate N-acetyltransferase|nr:bifunctional UDP-N-acetylglucosamine diphosphorylase/glucosamine-1-phosphate N-acetyltransferase GlmU [Hyphomicrobiaceae bacterium]